MKKQLLFIHSLGVPMLIFLFFLPLPYMPTAEVIDIRLSYGGRPGCWGAGPCRIQLANDNSTMVGQNEGSGTLEVTTEGRLLLRIERSTMSSSIREQQFSKSSFLVPQDFQIPVEILQQLGLKKETYFWKSGDYPVVEQESFYQIVF